MLFRSLVAAQLRQVQAQQVAGGDLGEEGLGGGHGHLRPGVGVQDGVGLAGDGRGTAAFAADDAAINLLPYPNKGEFNKLLTYKPNKEAKIGLTVQGANVNYLPEFFSAQKAASVIFKGSDGVTAGATLAESVEGGSNYVASSTVTAAKNLSYGPKMVNAKLPDAAGWTGSIDLGVVLNPNSEVSAKKINISFYKGTPSRRQIGRASCRERV